MGFIILWGPCSILLFVLVLRRLFSPLAKVPGPRLALFTSLTLRYHELRGKRTRYIHRLHQKYGDVVRIAPDEVVFSSLEAMREIYSSKGSGYDKSTFYNLFRQFGLSTMFSHRDKDTHGQRRRIIADRYANSNVMKTDSIRGIEERSGNFLAKCIQLNHEMDIYAYLHSYAFDCATHHLFHPYGANSLVKDEDEAIMREVSFDSSLVARLLMYYNKTLGTLINQSGILGRARDVPMAKAMVLHGSKQTDCADFTLVSRLAEEKHGLRHLDIASECMDHMIAGIETTGDALCFLMWQISQPGYEGIQKKLHAELTSNPDMPFDQLPYLDAVMKEGLRMFPSIPMSLPRCVPEGGKTIDGYWLPGGTIVSCQPYSMHRMNKEAFPNPDAFIPERWLEEKGLAERNRLFFTFSLGGRACIGRHVATAEMKILLRDIYSRYQTTPAVGMTADMSMDDQIFTSRPKDQKCLLKFNEVI